jgi:hypothetical protein
MSRRHIRAAFCHVRAWYQPLTPGEFKNSHILNGSSQPILSRIKVRGSKVAARTAGADTRFPT